MLELYEKFRSLGGVRAKDSSDEKVVRGAGAHLRLSVPDLDTLARLFLDKTLPVSARQHVIRMM